MSSVTPIAYKFFQFPPDDHRLQLQKTYIRPPLKYVLELDILTKILQFIAIFRFLSTLSTIADLTIP